MGKKVVIERISVLKLGLVSAGITGIIGLLLILLVLLGVGPLLFAGGLKIVGMSLITIIGLYITWVVTSFIGGIIGAVIYNTIASIIGGVEIELGESK